MLPQRHPTSTSSGGQSPAKFRFPVTPPEAPEAEDETTSFGLGDDEYSGPEIRPLDASIAARLSSLPYPGLVLPLQKEEELDLLLSGLGKRWVVLEMGAAWSAASAAMRAEFEVLAKSYPTWVFLRVDVNQLPGIAGRWAATRIPCYIFFWRGVEETQFAGASARKLREVLEDCSLLGPAPVAAHADPAGRVRDWKLPVREA
mmetsp:Transcript_25902/g.48642  ORF Transcript_25902/g.48642 Transcript_25902/m.48642 type:complete len:202 (-) Transcript_25902:10-615(-)